MPLIRRYSTILDQVATEPNENIDKLEVFRKIGAICLKCMMQHGAPKRENKK